MGQVVVYNQQVYHLSKRTIDLDVSTYITFDKARPRAECVPQPPCQGIVGLLRVSREMGCVKFKLMQSSDMYKLPSLRLPVRALSATSAGLTSWHVPVCRTAKF